MEDDLIFLLIVQIEPNLSFLLRNGGLASPSFVWSWHSSAPACFDIFVKNAISFIVNKQHNVVFHMEQFTIIIKVSPETCNYVMVLFLKK